MADRLALIASIGAQIAALEGSEARACQAVLKAALAQIVEDAGAIAQAEKRKEKDRRRKKGDDTPALALVTPTPSASTAPTQETNDRNSANNGNSDRSTESAEGAPAMNGAKAAHITRALGSEVQEQEQEQKQKQEIANAISPGDAPGDDAIADPLGVTLGSKLRRGGPSPAERAAIKTAVDFVVAKYLERHPRRRPGEADRGLIARRLASYTARELAEAIDGNADDDWAQQTGKHELSWTLRNNGNIDNYRMKFAAGARGAEQLAETVQRTGWF